MPVVNPIAFGLLAAVAAGGTVSSGSLSFDNAGGVSFGIAGQTITASAPAGGGGLTNIRVSAGTTSNLLSAVTFADSNGISFGLNASTVTASYTVPSTAGLLSAINVSAGTTSTNASAFTFSDSNGLAFGLNGRTVTGSYTVPSTAGLLSAINISAGTTSTNASAFTFSNSNGVSFGINGRTVTGSVATSLTNINVSGGTTSNLLSAITFSNSNGVSFGLNGSTMTASVAAGLTNINVSAGTTSNLLSAMTFSNSNGVTFGLNASTVTASVAAIQTLFSYDIPSNAQSASGTLSANNGTSGAASFFPFEIDNHVAVGWVNCVMSMNFLTVGTSSGRQSQTVSYGLYSRGTGTNSTTLGSFTSGSFSLGVTGNNSSYTINQPTTTNNTGYGTQTTNSSGVNISSQYTGAKLVQFAINSTMSPGHYWLGVFFRNSTSSVNVGLSESLIGAHVGVAASVAPIGSLSSAFTSGTNAVLAIGGNFYPFLASFTSAAQTNLPNSVALSALVQDVGVQPYLRLNSTS